MAKDITRPDPGIVLDLLQAFRCSKAMFTAVSLGVFDALSAGPKPLRILADELKANPDALERLLDACVGLQLLDRDDQGYRNTPVTSTYLCRSSPHRLTGYIHYSSDVMWKLWGNLEDAVREGSHRWKQTFGWDGPIFSHFFHTEEAKREFLMGMHGYGLISSPQVVAAFDLSKYRCLVDLGGATGHLASTACERYRELRAVVFDLPDAVALAQEIVGASAVAERIKVGDEVTEVAIRLDEVGDTQRRLALGNRGGAVLTRELVAREHQRPALVDGLRIALVLPVQPLDVVRVGARDEVEKVHDGRFTL